MTNLPSGTVTFLFTDIEGSTKLAQEYPDKWESLRDGHHAILRSAIEAHAGYVFQIIGDAFCVAFHTADDALRTTVKSRTDLHNEAWGETPIKVRMGIHTGKAEVQENGEYHGYLTLSLVQRVMSAGHGGQILLSDATEKLLLDQLPKDVSLRDMGEHKFKDVPHPGAVAGRVPRQTLQHEAAGRPAAVPAEFAGNPAKEREIDHPGCDWAVFAVQR